MPKKIYNEEEDSRRMIEHINQQSAAQQADTGSVSQKQAEERVKTYRKNMWRSVGRVALTAAINVGLYFAVKHDLIASVLAVPASYICMFFTGWYLCKWHGFYKKVTK